MAIIGIHFGDERCSVSCCLYGSEMIREVPISLYYEKEAESQNGSCSDKYKVSAWGQEANLRHGRDLAAEATSSEVRRGVYVENFWGHLSSGQATSQMWWWQGDQRRANAGVGDIPQGLSLVTVLTDYFTKLSESAIRYVNCNGRDSITKESTQWSLTVPCIWDESVLETVSECVERAGMTAGPLCPPEVAALASPHPVCFVPEWEAAALHCFNGFRLELGSEVLVVDVRNHVTNLVTLRECEGAFSFVEGRTIASGCCLNDMDEKFYDKVRASIDCFHELERHNPAIRTSLRKGWHNFCFYLDLVHNIRWFKLPEKLRKAWKEHNRSRRDDKHRVRGLYVDWEQICGPLADRIVNLIKECLRPDVKGLCIIGEYSFPSYLGKRIGSVFGSKFGDGMKLPSYPSGTMCRGAVNFGLTLALRSPRSMRYELELQRSRSKELLDRAALGRVVQKQLSEVNENVMNCVEIINKVCLEALRSVDASQGLADFIRKVHTRSIRQSELFMEAVAAFQSRKSWHRHSATETARSVTESGTGNFLQEWQPEMSVQRTSYEAEVQRVLGEMIEAMGSARTLKENNAKLEAENLAFRAQVQSLQVGMDRIESEKQRIETQIVCSICQDRRRNVVILPCLHAQYCEVCLAQHRATRGTCPTCRGAIRGTLQLFS